ncbi:MAG TPA: guanylate kinase [Candidatus Eisenbacteria bacterium]|jgi:guanylate kinase|nr:guanylate kinase [Candidatus Eisenbacteria bacterium]
MSNKPKRLGRLFVISASSGTGKTTLAKKLLEEDKNLVQSVSYTTRQPRHTEIQGKDYIFVTPQEFHAIRKKHGFLEWANVFGRYYGTPKKEVGEHVKRGRDVLLLIDVQGAKKVKKTKPDAVFIFLAPPSKEELKRRLEKRGTEGPKEIMRRYNVATKELVELNDLKLCDYRIVNREIPVATEVLKSIIRGERLRTKINV